MTTRILGIETSCDETAAAIVADGRWVQSSVIASQHDLHRQYRGVVPEIASRAHLERINPVIEQALDTARLAFDQVDAVAIGNRPGLIGSLMVGVSAAKTIAWATGRPLLGIDHVTAHLYAATMSESESATQAAQATEDGTDVYPAVGLVVSGGHTSLFLVESPTDAHVLGRTIDDAVGEAYDKAAVILNLGYPGGPCLDRLAQTGNPQAYDLPRSLLGRESLDFSFSGLKTALLYKVCGQPRGRGSKAIFERSAADLSDTQRRDLAAAFQAAAVDTLMIKINRALDLANQQGRPARSLLVGGGVSANSLLRQRVTELGTQRNLSVGLPPMSLCLDNAAMIAGLAYHRWRQKDFDDLHLRAIATTD